MRPPAMCVCMAGHCAFLRASSRSQAGIDVILAALVAHHRLRADAAFSLFATARSVGLLVRCMD